MAALWNICTLLFLSTLIAADDSQSPRRRGIDSSSCASPPYSGTTCSSSDPTDCPCTALTTSEKAQILSAHNDNRDLAASGNADCATSTGSSTTPCPTASDMNALVWDDGLETIATYWAHQCNYGHHNTEEPGEQNDMYTVLCDDDDCLAIGYDDQWIGENLAVSASSTGSYDIDDVISGITSWYAESSDYHFDSQTSFGTTGHWTQGVWAKTRYLGCGYASCDVDSPFGSSFSEWLFVVCKYFPGGNYNSADPYTDGTKCSDCDDDRTECEGDDSGLCGGDICLNCAADFFQSACTYDDSTCTDLVTDSDTDTDTTDTDTDTDTGSDTDTTSDTDTLAEDTDTDVDLDQSGVTGKEAGISMFAVLLLMLFNL